MWGEPDHVSVVGRASSTIGRRDSIPCGQQAWSAYSPRRLATKVARTPRLGCPQSMQKGCPAGSAYTWWPRLVPRLGAAWRSRAPRAITCSCCLRLLDVQVEVYLLGRLPVGPDGRHMFRRQLDTHPPLARRVDDAVPILVLKDMASQDGSPEQLSACRSRASNTTTWRTISTSRSYGVSQSPFGRS